MISQFIWFNKKIQVNKTHAFFSSLSDKGLNFVGKLFNRHRKLKTCDCLKEEFSLTNSKKFHYFK